MEAKGGRPFRCATLYTNLWETSPPALLLDRYVSTKQLRAGRTRRRPAIKQAPHVLPPLRNDILQARRRLFPLTFACRGFFFLYYITPLVIFMRSPAARLCVSEIGNLARGDEQKRKKDRLSPKRRKNLTVLFRYRIDTGKVKNRHTHKRAGVRGCSVCEKAVRECHCLRLFGTKRSFAVSGCFSFFYDISDDSQACKEP